MPGYSSIFKRDLEIRAAKKVLLGVLVPTTFNLEKAQSLLINNPNLLYIKNIVSDERRLISGSAFQAALGVKAIGWINWMWKKIIQPTNTHEVAKIQYDEQLDETNARKNRFLKFILEEHAI